DCDRRGSDPFLDTRKTRETVFQARLGLTTGGSPQGQGTMPIRFRCAYCNQLMGIARRKAGTVVRCPRCAGQVIVPDPGPEAADAGGERNGPGGGPAASGAASALSAAVSAAAGHVSRAGVIRAERL